MAHLLDRAFNAGLLPNLLELGIGLLVVVTANVTAHRQGTAG
jgi:hypothetical protein